MQKLLALSILVSSIALAQPSAWEEKVETLLPAFGHRNWIVIADSAYPDQSRPGIETVVANADQVTVLRRVLAMVAAQKHIRPIVHIDSELRYVDDKDAPGIAAYRKALEAIFRGKEVDSIPHEQVIAKLDEAAQTFRVLIVKTNMTVPYTSVFLQLDCAYWSADSEKKLRAAMTAAGVK